MSTDLAAALREHFGFERFKPGQKEVIEPGRSAAAVFPTGGGKSVCYQLPALLMPGTALVVSPLIALMKDQIDALTARGIAARRLDSTLDAAEYRRTMEAAYRAFSYRRPFPHFLIEFTSGHQLLNQARRSRAGGRPPARRHS